ncbi:neural cell adhesion molecule 1-like isoform X2 [Oscarella lobularis]|uniref:neural cell adhesion molecule 1-like isoform X2 n=1 Tax=Oscarella lobularis TaxID=121494 RepID=UPI0033138D2F
MPAGGRLFFMAPKYPSVLLVALFCFKMSTGFYVEVEADPFVVDQGQPFSVSCFIYADRPLTKPAEIAWEKNQEALGMDRKRVVVNDDYSISVSEAITGDGGVYKCKATAHIEGKIVHASSSVRVVVRAATTIEYRSSHVSVTEGANASLECIGQGLQMGVHWRYKWISIFQSEKYKLSFFPAEGRSVLKITGAEISDSGSYQCQSGDAVAKVVLTVHEVRLSKLKYDEGKLQSALLTCNYNQSSLGLNQSVRVTWSKDGELLNDSQLSKHLFPYYSEGFALVVQNATCVDTALYACSIYLNDELDAMCYTQLYVEGHPKPPTQVRAELDCSDSALRVTWLPSSCSSFEDFLGYQVTVTMVNTKAIYPERINLFVSKPNVSIALENTWSCTNCNLLYGVEVTSKNIYGESKHIVASRGRSSGRRCGGSSDPILQSLPGIQIWTVDLNCSCSKSKDVFNIASYVKNITTTYLTRTSPELQYLISSTSAEVVDRAVSLFLYRVKLTNASFFDATREVAKIAGSIHNCDYLYMEEALGSTRCGGVEEHRCRVPKSLSRIRKWCSTPHN